MCRLRLTPSTCLSGCTFPNLPCLWIMPLPSYLHPLQQQPQGLASPGSPFAMGWAQVVPREEQGLYVIPSSPLYDCKFRVCSLPPSIQANNKNPKPMLGLSASFSSPSLKEPRSPIWLLYDKPIRQRLLIRLMKGEGIWGKRRREGMWQRPQWKRESTAPPSLLWCFIQSICKWASGNSINNKWEALDRGEEGRRDCSAVPCQQGSQAPCLINQGEPFSGGFSCMSIFRPLKRLLYHLANKRRRSEAFLANRSQPKRQSHYIKTQGLVTFIHLGLSIEVITQKIC